MTRASGWRDALDMAVAVALGIVWILAAFALAWLFGPPASY